MDVGFYIQDEYWEVVEDLPASKQDAYIGALARLYFAGEGTELKDRNLSKLYKLASKRVVEARRKALERADKTTDETTDKNPPHVQRDTPEDMKTEVVLIERERESKGKNVRFTPPTREEAAEYLESVGLKADLDKVFDHYEANGWRCGRNPMKDWRAAFRRAAKEWAKGVPDADAEYADAI